MKLQEAVRLYTVCAKADGKSDRTIEWVTCAARYLGRFLGDESADIAVVDADCLRRFILALREQPAYVHHPTNKVKDRPIKPESAACYVRAIKSLFAMLTREGYLEENPIARVKAPKVTIKEMPVLTEAEIQLFLAQIDKTTAVGARNYAVILTLLDTGIRVSELCGLSIKDVDFDWVTCASWVKATRSAWSRWVTNSPSCCSNTATSAINRACPRPRRFLPPRKGSGSPATASRNSSASTPARRVSSTSGSALTPSAAPRLCCSSGTVVMFSASKNASATPTFP